MRYVLALLLIAALPSHAAFFGALVPSTTYYVNGSTGNDSNNGTSTATPFLTVSHCIAALIGAQSCAVWGGSTATGQLKYRESATLTAVNQGLVGWGTYQPIFDCSDVISGGAWSNYNGSIYQATVTTDASITGFLRIWENGTAFTMSASLGALTSPGYFIAGNGVLSGTSHTVYVYATGGGNPASNGKTYEFNARNYGVFSQYKATVSNVQTRRNYANNGSFEIGGYSLATDITANDGTKHNALMHGGSTYRNTTLVDSYYNGSPKIALVLNDNSPTGQDATIDGGSYTETVELTGVGLYGHTNVGGTFGLVTIKNFTTVGAASSVSGFTSTGMLISGGTYNAGITMGSPVSVIRNATVNAQIGIPYTVSAELDTVTASCTCTNGIVLVGPSVSPAVNIHDSDFSNAVEFYGAIYISVGATPASFTSQRNVFRAPVRTNHILGPGNTALPVGSTLSGNTYHYPTGLSSWIVFRGTTYDISNSGQWTSWLAIEPTATRVTP